MPDPSRVAEPFGAGERFTTWPDHGGLRARQDRAGQNADDQEQSAHG